MRLSKLALAAAGLALPVILAGHAGAATNLITNGDFSQGTSPWTPNDQQTGLGTSLDGRLVISNVSGYSGLSTDWAEQCITGIDDAYEYEFAGDMFIPSGQQRHGMLVFSLTAFSSTDCGAGYAQSQFVDSFFDIGVLEHRSLTLKPLDGVQSFRVRLTVQTTNAGPAENPNAWYSGHFDNITLEQGVLKDPPPDDPQDPPTDDPQDPPADDPQDPPADDPQDPPADDPAPDEPVEPLQPVDPGVKDEPPVFPDVPPVFEIPGPQGTGHVFPTPVVPAVEPPASPSPQADAPEQPAPSQPAPPPTVAPQPGATPLPPSAGSGLDSTSSTNLPVIAGLALTLLAALTAAFAAAGASMKGR